MVAKVIHFTLIFIVSPLLGTKSSPSSPTETDKLVFLTIYLYLKLRLPTVRFLPYRYRSAFFTDKVLPCRNRPEIFRLGFNPYRWKIFQLTES